MGDSHHKVGLYRWKRQTDPMVYSRSQKVTSNKDVQDWIQKVEQASSAAAEKVLGLKPQRVHSSNKRVAALSTVDQLREHDSALTEAQELLSQWMDEKVSLDTVNYDDESFENDALKQRKIHSSVKKEWDHLLENNYESYELPTEKIKREKEDPYAFLDQLDEGQAVESILDHMLNKKVIKDEFTEDTGLNNWSTHKDPRTKMELRHQQVKENREKREKEIERKRREQQAKKTAHHQAKQMILKEERNKVLKSRQEEMEIRKEMAKIRKEMQAKKERIKETRLCQKTERELMNAEAQIKVDDERKIEVEAMNLQEKRKAEERQRLLMEKLSEIETSQKANNLKILQQHFSAWYKLVLTRRMQIGKARALSDWKLLLRAWNAWKSYVRSKKLDLEAKQHQIDIIQAHRNMQLAESHHKLTLLRRYFTAWQQWIKQEQEKNELECAQEKTKQKMAALLEAASKGKLSTDHDSEILSDRLKQKETSKVEQVKHQNRAESARSDVSSVANNSRSQTRDHGRVSPPNRIPTEAWQVTKKHINLTAEEIAGLGGGNIERYTEVQLRKRFGTQPWMNTKYITNNFENRHKAQQKILKDQQKQLQEQQKLIEELKFTQEKQILLQQAKTQQEIQRLIDQQPLSEVVVQTGNKPSVSSSSSTSKQTERLLSSSTVGIPISKMDDRKSDRTSREGSETERTSISKTSSVKSANSKHLALLKKMEERAAERARLKAEREEKRRKAEEENMERLKAEEDQLLKQQEEEKRARAEAYREKKRLEKQRELEKQKREERMKEIMALADTHYLKSLLKYKGMIRFKKLVEMKRQMEVKATKHYRNSLKRKALHTWHSNVVQIDKDREDMADKMQEYLLIKHCFNNWRKFRHHIEILEGRAARYHNRLLKHKILLAWKDYAMKEKISEREKEERAYEHYIWKLKSRCFHTWRGHPEELRREQERNKRRAEMRQTVAAMLPDFEMSLTQSQNKDIL